MVGCSTQVLVVTVVVIAVAFVTIIMTVYSDHYKQTTILVEYETYPFRGKTTITRDDVVDCSQMYKSHFVAMNLSIPIQTTGDSVIIYGKKGVGKTHLLRCILPPNDHRLIIELNDTNIFSDLLVKTSSSDMKQPQQPQAPHDMFFAFGKKSNVNLKQNRLTWSRVCHVVLQQIQKSFLNNYKNSLTYHDGPPLLRVEEKLAYDFLYYMMDLMQKSSISENKKKRFIASFGKAFLKRSFVSEDSSSTIILKSIQKDLRMDTPVALSSLSDQELKKLLSFCAKVSEAYLKKTLTIVVDGLDEISRFEMKSYDHEHFPLLGSIHREDFHQRLIELLLTEFANMAINKELSILYFLPSENIDYHKLATTTVGKRPWKKLKTYELKWSHDDILEFGRVRYNRWIQRRKKTRGGDNTIIYPSFEQFLSFGTMDTRSQYYLSHLHTPREFLKFMSVLGKTLIMRKHSDEKVKHIVLATRVLQIKESVCSIFCYDGKEKSCREDTPGFCQSSYKNDNYFFLFMEVVEFILHKVYYNFNLFYSSTEFMHWMVAHVVEGFQLLAAN